MGLREEAIRAAQVEDQWQSEEAEKRRQAEECSRDAHIEEAKQRAVELFRAWLKNITKVEPDVAIESIEYEQVAKETSDPPYYDWK